MQTASEKRIYASLPPLLVGQDSHLQSKLGPLDRCAAFWPIFENTG